MDMNDTSPDKNIKSRSTLLQFLIAVCGLVFIAIAVLLVNGSPGIQPVVVAMAMAGAIVLLVGVFFFRFFFSPKQSQCYSDTNSDEGIIPYTSYKGIPAMLQSIDAKGRIIGVSDYWLQNFGYTLDEVVGRLSYDFVTPESAKYIKSFVEEELLRVGFNHSISCRYIRKNGSVFDAILSVTLVRDSSGGLLGCHTAITDVSNQKLTENLLRANKEVYRKIVHSIPGVFLQTDVKGTINYVNDRGLEILRKYSSLDVIGQNVLTLVAPEDVERAKVNFRAMFDGRVEVEEYRLNFGQVEWVYGEVGSDVLRGDDGTPYGAILIAKDITLRKRYEKELRRSEEKYRSLVETSPNITWEIRPDGSFLYVSPQAYGILGYTPEELCQIRIYDIIATKEIDRTVSLLYDSITSRKHVVGFEVEARNGITGKNIYLDIHSSLFYNDEGVIQGLRGIAMDITARKQAELEVEKFREYLDMVLKAGGIGIWFADFDENRIVVDEVWAQLLGYSPSDVEGLLADTVYREFIHPDDVEMVKEHINASKVGDDSRNSIEHRMITKSGEIKWVLATIKVLEVNRQGNPCRIIGFMKDVTDRKKAELQIQEANTTKDKLFSIIAHDLKNPLGVIIGFSQLLEQNLGSCSSATIAEYSKQISVSANGLGQLLENLLEWANTQRGMVKFNPKNLMLDALIDEELQALSFMAQKKNITINPFNNSIRIYADSDLLRIVIRNLITNALKYSHADSRVDVYSLQYPDRVEINVHDYGMGMSPETMSGMFGLSASKSQRGTANEKGTGLGLLICKEFVEKHGGKIWVDSKLGEGSTFTFSIPVQSVS